MNFSDDEIMDAISNNDITVLNELLKKVSVDYRIKDENNDTLLMYSISDKDSDAYKLFLSNGANLNLTNEEGESIVHCAIYSGNLDRLIKVANKQNIQRSSFNGTTPLMLAIALEKFKMINLLLKMGADINASDQDGNYPIHIASMLGLLKVVSTLIKLGANINIKTSKGNYPLALAVNNDHISVAKILFKTMYFDYIEDVYTV